MTQAWQDKVFLDECTDDNGVTRRELVRQNLKRAGVSPESLWRLSKDDPNKPDSFKKTIIRNWLDPNSGTISTDSDLYNFVISKAVALSDAKPKKERIHLDEKVDGKNQTWRETLKELFFKKGYRARTLWREIESDKNLPAGLKESTINRWINQGGTTKTADKALVDYIVKKLQAKPTILSARPDVYLDHRIKKDLPSRRRAFERLLSRAGIRPQAFFALIKDDPNKPTSLTLPILKSWVENKGVQRAKADHWDFALKRLLELPKGKINLDDLSGDLSYRDHLRALLKEAKFSSSKFIVHIGGDAENPGVSRTMFYGWLDRNKPTGSADRVHLSYAFRKLRKTLDWHPPEAIKTKQIGRNMPDGGVEASDILESARRFVQYQRRRLNDSNPNDFVYALHASTLSRAFSSGQVNGWEDYVTPSFLKTGKPPRSLNHFLAAAGVYSKKGTRSMMHDFAEPR
ncbi:MAG: hypothetical protein AB8B83_01650 [Bdellovibrionales bacterium]